MAGERYVLHIQGDRLEVAFVDLGRLHHQFRLRQSRHWAGQVARTRRAADSELSVRNVATERPDGNRLAVLGSSPDHGGSYGRRLGDDMVQPGARMGPHHAKLRGLLRYDGSPGLSTRLLLGARLASARRRVPGARRQLVVCRRGYIGAVGDGDDAGALGRARRCRRWPGRRARPSDPPCTAFAACPMAPPGRSASVRRAADQPAEILSCASRRLGSGCRCRRFFPREPTAGRPRTSERRRSVALRLVRQPGRGLLRALSPLSRRHVGRRSAFR